MAMLLVVTGRQPITPRHLVAAPVAFAVSALHFDAMPATNHGGLSSRTTRRCHLPSRSSCRLPIRFADLSLKNAIALMMLVGVAVAVFAAGAPALKWQGTRASRIREPWCCSSRCGSHGDDRDALTTFAAHIVDRWSCGGRTSTRRSRMSRVLDRWERRTRSTLSHSAFDRPLAAEIRRTTTRRDADQRAALRAWLARWRGSRPGRAREAADGRSPHHAFRRSLRGRSACCRTMCIY